MLHMAFLCFVLGVACGFYVWMYEEWHVGNETLANVLCVVRALCAVGIICALVSSFGFLETAQILTQRMAFSSNESSTPKTFLSILIAIGVAIHIAYLMRDEDISVLSLIPWIIAAYIVFH